MSASELSLEIQDIENIILFPFFSFETLHFYKDQNITNSFCVEREDMQI